MARFRLYFLHVKNHAQDIWACDFLPVVDLFFRPLFLFFIMELGSRVERSSHDLTVTCPDARRTRAHSYWIASREFVVQFRS